MNLFFPVGDWQDPRPYEALNSLDRAGLAWEFVRRDPRYACSIPPLPVGLHRAGVTVEIIPPDEPPAATWGLSFR
ncbi:MAG: hypothetical protein EOP84_26530 [Verrucomicrobiaceae bacterium]|nr:MAG: hypothetical protein EOP84_26530 [Verrucomicrobiaceae bacterium]